MYGIQYFLLLHILSLDLTSVFFRYTTLIYYFFRKKTLPGNCVRPKLSEKISCCPFEYRFGIRTVSEFRNFGLRLAPILLIRPRRDTDRLRLYLPATAPLGPPVLGDVRVLEVSNSPFDQSGLDRGLVTKGCGMPTLGVTEPFGGSDEGLWEKSPFLELMALLMRHTSWLFLPAILRSSLAAYRRKRQEVV